MARRAELDVTSILDSDATTVVPGLSEEPGEDDQPDTDESKPAKGAKGELSVIRRMVAALDTLDSDTARHRALDWLMDYYGENLPE